MTQTCNRLFLRRRKGDQEFKQTTLYARLRTGSAFPQIHWKQVGFVSQPPSAGYCQPFQKAKAALAKTLSPEPQPCIHHCLQTVWETCSTTLVLKVSIIVTKMPLERKNSKCTSQIRKGPLFIPAFTKIVSNIPCCLTELKAKQSFCSPWKYQIYYLEKTFRLQQYDIIQQQQNAPKYILSSLPVTPTADSPGSTIIQSWKNIYPKCHSTARKNTKFPKYYKAQELYLGAICLYEFCIKNMFIISTSGFHFFIAVLALLHRNVSNVYIWKNNKYNK